MWDLPFPALLSKSSVSSPSAFCMSVSQMHPLCSWLSDHLFRGCRYSISLAGGGLGFFVHRRTWVRSHPPCSLHVVCAAPVRQASRWQGAHPSCFLLDSGKAASADPSRVSSSLSESHGDASGSGAEHIRLLFPENSHHCLRCCSAITSPLCNFLPPQVPTLQVLIPALDDNGAPPGPFPGWCAPPLPPPRH